jgi:hypothetical protein
MCYDTPMNTKHLLKNISPDTKTGHCYWCGVNVPVIRKAKKYYCAQDMDIPNVIKKAPDKSAAKYRSLEAKVKRLHSQYSLTYYQYLWLLDECNYACPLCLDPFTKDSPPHVDHNHSCCPDKNSCGECVRGLLCRMCNSGIGYFRDSSRALTRASEYLARP